MQRIVNILVRMGDSKISGSPIMKVFKNFKKSVKGGSKWSHLY